MNVEHTVGVQLAIVGVVVTALNQFAIPVLQFRQLFLQNVLLVERVVHLLISGQ